jgi:hypothetical protein
MSRVTLRRYSSIKMADWRSLLVTLVCVSVLGAVTVTAGSASATTETSHAAKLKWSAGTTLVSGSGGVTTVSCASATYCVAGDLTGGVSTYNGTTWSTPVTIDAAHAIASMSCPTVTFCVATDRSGNYIVWNSGSWGRPTAFASPQSPAMVAVSCTSPNFCLAVGRTANFAPADFYYLDGTWYPDAVAFASTDIIPFDAVSCTSSFVCLATDQGGGVMTFTFTSSLTPQLTHPASPTQIDPGVQGYTGASISCVSASSCVVGSFANQVSTYNGTTWTTTAVFPSTSLGVLVSCAQSTCVASDSSGQGVSAVAPFTSWSAMGQLGALAQITGLSCFASAASAACLAVDNDGFSIAIALGSGGVPSYSEASSSFDAPHTLSSVTCANASYCIASDIAGETVTYRAGAWSTPHTITTTPLGIREVRCGASAHPYQSLQCVAVLGDFLALHLSSYRSAWLPVLSSSSPAYAVSCAKQCEYLSPEGRSSGLVHGYLPKLPSGAIATDVSCPTGGVDCVAIDSSGDSYISEKGLWVQGPTVAKRVITWSLSCVSMNFCVAIDIEGQAFTYNGVKWSAPQKVSGLGLYSVSCGATYFCAASDVLGGAYVFNGTTWSQTASVTAINSLRSLSCASATSCVGIDSTRAYSLVIPTDKTAVTLLAPLRGANVVGRTIIGALVTASSAPTGEITLSARLGASAWSCVAILKRVSATQASAHCILATTHVGETTIEASFTGSFGFAPAPVVSRHEMVIAK